MEIPESRIHGAVAIPSNLLRYPTGSGISPILANIYLDELDKFMEGYKAKFDVGSSRKRRFCHEYHVAKYRVEKYKRKGAQCWDSLSEPERKLRSKMLKSLQREMRATPAAISKDDEYKTIQYVRYCDDFIIGVIGSKEDAQRVKADVKQFLSDRLKLKISEDKTKITHTGDRARFLGYDITVSRSQTATKKKDGRTRRCHSYVVNLLVPREKWVGKLLEYKAIKVILNNNGKERFKALHRNKLINKPNIEILSNYNAEIRGLYNYYSIANDSYKVGIFANVMKYSMFKTFANKYKTNVHRIKARFFKGNNFTVEYQTKKGQKQAVFYNQGFCRKLEAMTAETSLLPQYQKYDRFNSLKNRIKLGLCELCEKKTSDVSLHQVKKLKDLKGVKAWEILMLKLRRKTLAVCPECHGEIHS
ncbi:MAG: reverse transcriptase domain-containing protein [Desulfosporosinus sp.]|nr:reverse transcriptase domain-containing protein [Desulfosporosinus sp.]